MKVGSRDKFTAINRFVPCGRLMYNHNSGLKIDGVVTEQIMKNHAEPFMLNGTQSKFGSDYMLQISFRFSQLY